MDESISRAAGASHGTAVTAADFRDMITLMDESISRAAGASHGTAVTAADFRDMIIDMDRNPVRRNTTYQPIESGITLR
jgi:2-iminoacetate synthase ThiH